MTSWSVVGHEWALSLLGQAIASGRLNHAYLFTGPPNVGKTTVARAFAQALLCERNRGYPCDECRTCRQVASGRHPDVQLLAAERNTIQIDQVRTVQSDAALAPLEGRYRIFIICEVERATPPAANALLKTLEEPPPQVVLMLTSARRDLVLPTVVSRCQVVGLRPLPQEQVRSALEQRWGVDEERASLLSRLSSGRLGWAVTAHTDPELWRRRAKAFDDLLSLTGEGYLGRLSYSEVLSRPQLAASGRVDNVEAVLGLWVTWWRDVWLIQHGDADALVNLDRRAQLSQQAGLYRPEQVTTVLEDLMETFRHIRANVNTRLALDVLMLKLPRPQVL